MPAASHKTHRGVLFLGVSNAARSQLAEAITRHLQPDADAWSAGERPSHVRPHVREVLDEVGIDSFGLRAKSIYEVPLEDVDVLVTLSLPTPDLLMPGRIERVAWPLPDPDSAPADEKLEAYRACREELQRRLPGLLARLEEGAPPRS